MTLARVIYRFATYAPKGHHKSAQGNALGYVACISNSAL